MPGRRPTGLLVGSVGVSVAVLVSGAGTILRAILDAGLPVAVVVADRPCPALGIAEAASVPAVLVARATFGPDFDRLAYTHQVLDALAPYRPKLVAIAGFGTILDKPAFEQYEGRILNTHPALLPAFRGHKAVRQALDAGVKVTGCTVHVATLEVDAGPILAQEAVPVLAGDTEETLHERIKAVERVLYPDTIRARLDELAGETTEET